MSAESAGSTPGDTPDAFPPPAAQPSPEGLRGSQLVHASYATVAEAFAGFAEEHPQDMPLANSPKIPTTLRPRPDIGPRSGMEHRERAPGYQVISSFSAVQTRYVGISMRALDLLVRGQSLAEQGDDAPRLPTFTERFTGAFLAEQPTLRSTTGALTTALVGLYADFGRLYPNLTPAIDATFRVGGMSGTIQVVTQGGNYLGRALAGELEPTGEAYLGELATSREFTGHFPRFDFGRPDELLEAEVWCPAELWARTALALTRDASLLLANDPEVRDSYGPDNPLASRFRQSADRPPSETDNYNAIRAQIDRIVQDAADAHARGELA